MTVWDLQEQFDNATSDVERDRIRGEVREAGYPGVADTIGHSSEQQQRIAQQNRNRKWDAN